MQFRIILSIFLVIFCVLSLIVKEQYPFSNFPMYANPGPDRYFYWLATANGEPIPVKTFTNHSAAELGKIIRTFINIESKNDLSSEAISQTMGSRVLTYLRGKSVNFNKILPSKMAIMRTDIIYQNGQVLEVPVIYFSE